MNIQFYQVNKNQAMTIGLPASFTVEIRDGAYYLWRDDPMSGRSLHGLFNTMPQVETAIEIYIAGRKKK